MNFLFHFKAYRQLYMGIAIIMVILYHMPCADGTPFLVHLALSPLFIGVDIFMCASGFGLCYAIKKYSIPVFYKRRLTRIYPSYAILALGVTLLHLLGGQQFSLWDIFCQFSTLQCYSLGGFFFDWYLSAIILLYLFFPLLSKCRMPYTPSLLLSASAIWIAAVPHEWATEAIIARIGIFAYGIQLYRVLEEGAAARSLFINGLIFIGIATLLYLTSGCRGFIVTSALTPLLMYGIYLLHHSLPHHSYGSHITAAICKLGQYSLELYVANVAAIHTLQVFFPGKNAAYYWGVQIAYSFLMIGADRYLLRPLTRRLL